MSTLQLQAEKQYNRLNVSDYIAEFCGWEPIDEMIKYAGTQRNQLYVLSALKTGSRAQETLSLNTDNFTFDKRKKCILISNMKLEKRYKTVKDPITKKAIILPNGKRDTHPIQSIRKTFPVLFKEPLTSTWAKLLDPAFEALEQKPTAPAPLFASPYKSHKPLTVTWGYLLFRKISREIPKPLFNALGLNQPFYAKVENIQTGTIERIKIADSIHLWQHWARAQRASQLKAEYDFSESDLMEFFGWLHYGTALYYSRKGAAALARKMQKGIRQNAE